MALINCPECHAGISDLAAACIHCGCPLRPEEVAPDPSPVTHVLCPSCRTPIVRGSVSCPYCGAGREPTRVTTDENFLNRNRGCADLILILPFVPCVCGVVVYGSTIGIIPIAIGLFLVGWIASALWKKIGRPMWRERQRQHGKR